MKLFMSEIKSNDVPDLETWVQAYRDGDIVWREPLIMVHMRLIAATAADLARKYKRKNTATDFVAEGLLQLVIAVDAAQTALTDNHITPFLITTVKYRLRDFVSEDRLVPIPGRTYRKKVAEIKNIIFLTDHEIPIACSQEPMAELQDILELAIHTEDERRVIDLRAQEYSFRDMESILGLKRSRACQMVKDVESRFLKLHVG